MSFHGSGLGHDGSIVGSPKRAEVLDIGQNYESSLEEIMVVSPKQAQVLLNCGQTRLYELIDAGEVDSYKDGKSRKITLASIKARKARLLAAA